MSCSLQIVIPSWPNDSSRLSILESLSELINRIADLRTRNQHSTCHQDIARDDCWGYNNGVNSEREQ
jgi:hypothetical protein